MINQDLILDQSFDKCPKCKYEKGFHVVLMRVEEHQKRNTKINLKCPNCCEEFDFGLRATIEKDSEELEDIETDEMEFEEL